MIEVYASLFLFILTVVTVATGWTPSNLMSGWPTLGQVSLLLPLFLAIYLGIGLCLELAGALRWHPGDARSIWPADIGSLAWYGHLGIGIAMLLGLFVLTTRPVENAIYPTLLAFSCVIVLGHFVSSWRGARRPPLPARNVELVPGPGFIDISWEPPDDPRCVESLLVRCWGALVPTVPEQGQILCRGTLSEWRDTEVKPAEPYQYAVFTHDGRRRYSSTMGHFCEALPLPNPPAGLACVAERHAIRLNWHLIDSYDVDRVCFTRWALDDQDEEASRVLPPREDWRDSGLREGTRYRYRVYTVDATGQQSEPAEIVAATLVAPLEEFKAYARDRNQVMLSWQPPAQTSSFQGITLSRVRVDVVEESQELLKGSLDCEHLDRDLDYGATYEYRIEAFYIPPIKSEPSTTRATTGSRPAGVSDIISEPRRKSINLRWALPEHESVQTVRLVRLEYDPTARDIVERELLTGLATQYTDDLIEPETHCTYELSVQANDGHWSAPARIEAETLSPPLGVTDVVAEYDEAKGLVRLNWKLPDDEPISGTHIVRQAGRRPTGHEDGKAIYDGTGTEAEDQAVSPGEAYHYALYAYDGEKCFSMPIYARAYTHQMLELWVQYPTLRKKGKARLPSDLQMCRVVSILLRRKGVDLNSVTDWTVVVAESGQEVAPDQTLREAGVQSGQTVRLVWTTGLMETEQAPASVAKEDVE